MKTCPQCNASVSDEYRFCLNCGTVLETAANTAEEPLPTLVYQGQIATPESEPATTSSSVPPTTPRSVPPTTPSSVPPTTPSSVPPPTARSVPPTTPRSVPPTTPSSVPPTIPSTVDLTSKAPRRSWLPWVVVAACIVTIGVLVTIIAIQKKSSATETVATAQSPEPTPTVTTSETGLNPNSNQSMPSPSNSVSPPEKKETPTPSPTSTPTPETGSVASQQATPSATPSPAVVIITPTPTPTPKPITAPAVDPNRVYSNREVTDRAQILFQPKATYTEEARKNQVQGIVVLRVVLKADGTIGNVSVVSGLPDGLTERAIAAARSIKFTPAQKDGAPVSVALQIQYNFNLY